MTRETLWSEQDVVYHEILSDDIDGLKEMTTIIGKVVGEECKIAEKEVVTVDLKMLV